MSTEWMKDRKMRRAFERECLQYDSRYVEISTVGAEAIQGKAKLLRAFRNRYFLAQIYREPNGYLRLTVQRCAIDKNGMWVGGITWDELMTVKAMIGLGDRWAAEVYPPIDAIVNVANMRHLFLLPEAPAYAWRPNSIVGQRDAAPTVLGGADQGRATTNKERP